MLPGSARPFDPYGLRGDPYQIGAGERPRPLRVCERGAQARQIVAQDEAGRRAADLVRAFCGVVERARAPARAADDDKGRATLRNSIGQLHPSDRNRAVYSRAPADGRGRPWR